jgi:hypothetical protein
MKGFGWRLTHRKATVNGAKARRERCCTRLHDEWPTHKVGLSGLSEVCPLLAERAATRARRMGHARAAQNSSSAEP